MPVAPPQPAVLKGAHSSQPEIAILWLTAGLSCDGDTIAMTGATQPSLEDLLCGAHPLDARGSSSTIPFWPPKWATSSSSSSTGARAASSVRSSWWSRARSPTRPTRPRGTGRRSAPIRPPASRSPPATGSTGSRRKAWAVVAAGTCAAYGGIHAMEGNPTGAMGLPDYLGWNWRSGCRAPDRLPPGLSGAAGQHDRDAALPPPPGRRPRASDPAR